MHVAHTLVALLMELARTASEHARHVRVTAGAALSPFARRTFPVPPIYPRGGCMAVWVAVKVLVRFVLVRVLTCG